MAFHGISTEKQQEYMQIPMGKPPPGVIPRYEDFPRPLRGGMIASTILGSVLTTVLVLMRLYTRKFVIKKLWWDDYFLMLAWALYIAVLGVIWHIEFNGGGVHQWNLTYFNFVKLEYWIMISKALYIWDILILKISILLQIFRIFVPTRHGNGFVYWTTISLVSATFIFYFIEFFLDILQCSPRERAWNKTIPGHCIGSSNIIYTAGFNVASDLIIFALPLSRIWKLQMPLSRKIGVSLIFSVGAIAVFTSVMRLYYSWKVLHVKDASYYFLILTFWLNAELMAGIVVACMPTLPKFNAEARSVLSSAWSRFGVSKHTASVSYTDTFQDQAVWSSKNPSWRERWEAGSSHTHESSAVPLDEVHVSASSKG